jgi:hypothetical protein
MPEVATSFLSVSRVSAFISTIVRSSNLTNFVCFKIYLIREGVDRHLLCEGYSINEVALAFKVK